LFFFFIHSLINKQQPSSSLNSIESSAKQLDQQQQQQQPPISSKLSNYSEMDVSTPFADVKQISVQNKPLGGKVKFFLISKKLF